MKTSLEEISPVKKKLSVEVEAREVDKKISESYREIGKRAKIPGFRPGKAPRKILENYYGAQVAEDVEKNLISETFPKAIKEAKTVPLGTPLLEKGALKQGRNFTYSAVMEVRPQFDVENHLGLRLEKEELAITDEDVQKQLERIREANGKLTSLDKDRPIRKDDYVVMDYEGFEEGRPLDGMKAANFLLKVGGGEFHPKFEASIIGLDKGSETDIHVAFEEDYHHSGLAGKKADFKVKITDVKEMALPELDDAFARNIGTEFKDMEDLRNKIRETLTAQEERRIDSDLKLRLLQKISENFDFELPQSLVESELNFAVENVKQNLLRSGSNLEKAGLSEEKLREEFRASAEKRVKDLLILGRVAEQEGIQVDEKDLTKGFKELAERTGQDMEALRKYYEARNLVDSLREKLLEEKTLNYLVEHAKISMKGKGSKKQGALKSKEEKV
ncbi:MAG: trigger factor [Deltaproteobacteria bacterium]|nr:trigger factor [Deltaproteobacteria bacterium]